MKQKNKNLLNRQYIFLTINIIFLFLVSLVGYFITIGPDKWRVISAVPGPIRKIGKVVVVEIQDFPYLSYRFGGSGLPTYNIDIKKKDLDFLNNNLPKVGEELTEDNQIYVPAKFFAENKNYDIEMRYRGATSGHWSYQKKSLRLRFSAEDLFESQRLANFILPLDREMLAEELNSYRARKLGLITPDSKFVNITINNKNQSVYWEAQQTSKEFLETHRLSGDTNLYGDLMLYNPLFTNLNYWTKYTENPRAQKKDYSDLSALFETLNDSNDEEFNNNIFNILDEDSFYNWTIWYLIAGSSAQGSLHNVRMYFDSSIGKFKMVAWDLSISNWYFYPDKYGQVDPYMFEESDSPLAIRILRNPKFMAERNKRLWNYIKNEKNLTDELEYNDKVYEQVKKSFYQDRIKETSNKFVDDMVKTKRDLVENNFNKLRNLFINTNLSCQVSVYGDKNILKISAKSLSPIDVESIDLFDKNSVIINPNIVNETLTTDYFIKSGGSDGQNFDIFKLEETSVSLDVVGNLTNGVKIRAKNLYSGEELENNCTY